MPIEALVIDADRVQAGNLKGYLESYQLSVRIAHQADHGWVQIQRRQPDVVLMDALLPDMDGTALCRRVRERHDVPIIMLDSRRELADRVLAFEAGADDWVAKPFEPRELLARIHALVKRARPRGQRGARLSCGDLALETDKRLASLAGRQLDLTSTEYEVLALLMGTPGVVLSRDRILEALRGSECEAFNRSVDLTVSHLRSKLEDDARAPRYIKTVWGAGYLFMGSVN